MSWDSRIIISRIIVVAVYLAGIVAAVFSGFMVVLMVIAGGLFIWLVYLTGAGLNTASAPQGESYSLGRSLALVVAGLGIILAVSAFTSYGLTQTMWGGFTFNLTGLASALAILLITFLPLIMVQLFRSDTDAAPTTQPPAQEQPQVVVPPAQPYPFQPYDYEEEDLEEDEDWDEDEDDEEEEWDDEEDEYDEDEEEED